MEESSIRMNSLAEITDAVCDAKRALPQELRQALVDAFEAEVVSASPSQQPTNSLSALLPGTTVVLKLRPMAWQAVKAIAKCWLALQTYKQGLTVATAVLIMDVGEALQKLRSALEHLDADSGELCVYVQIGKAAQPIERAIGMYPSLEQARAAHEAFRESCQRTSCQHHVQGRCHLGNAQWLTLVDALKKREVVTEPVTGHLWLTL